MEFIGLRMVPSLDSGSSSNVPVPRSRLTPRRSRDYESVSNCSLPLKKRRFLSLSTPGEDVTTRNSSCAAASMWPSHGFTLPITSTPTALVNMNSQVTPTTYDASQGSQNRGLSKTDDEQLAALALLSAAAASDVRRSSSSSFSHPPDSPIAVSRYLQTIDEDDPLSAAIAITCLATPRSNKTTTEGAAGATTCTFSRSITQGSAPMINTVSPLPVKPLPLQCLPSSDSTSSATSSLSMSEEEGDEDEQDLTSNIKEEGEEPSASASSVFPYAYIKTTTSDTDIDHPLMHPLPHGCQVRTSRNNSFCRRQPCYDGSNYCKIHYSQYAADDGKKNALAAAKQRNVAAVTIKSLASKSRKSNHDRTKSKTVPLVPPFTSSNKATPPQDKRFTGCAGEIRCQATTTRGRACAYVAVGGKNNCKYCHLHVDYDKNPPARRNKAALIASTTSLMQKGSKLFVVGKTNTADCCRDGDVHVDVNGSNVVPTLPLLSMLATDVWFEKRVIISTGPFMNRTGHVVRWGNGWVTVQLDIEKKTTSSKSNNPNVVLHNRRSFELLLHPDQHHPNQTTANK